MLQGTKEALSSSTVNTCSLTEEEKIKISKEVYEDVKINEGFYEDKELTNYLEGVVKEIKSNVITDKDADKLPGKVIVTNSAKEDAFVSTDEHTYITKGLLKALKTEEELIAVFAHELGHVKHNHLEKSYAESKELQKNGTNALVSYILKNEYSKEHEFQADEFSFEALVKMKRNPSGITVVFGRLADKEKARWDYKKKLMIEENKRESEKKVDSLIKKIKVGKRFTRTHPYASERLERAVTLLSHELENHVGYYSAPVKIRINEDEWLSALTGTFDEKLAKFNERYPDGKAGRKDIETQRALFTTINDWGGMLRDERGKLLDIFAKEHAFSFMDFEKIFKNHKLFGSKYIETYLLNKIEVENNKIAEIEQLWKDDFHNDFLAYSYAEADGSHPDDIYKNCYGLRSANNNDGDITGSPQEQYYWAKKFGFRYFTKKYLFSEINTKQDLIKIINLPFMDMEVMPFKRDRSYFTNFFHSSGLVQLAKKVYENEKKTCAYNGDFLDFVLEVFKGKNIDIAFFNAVMEASEELFYELKEKNKSEEYFNRLNKLAHDFKLENSSNINKDDLIFNVEVFLRTKIKEVSGRTKVLLKILDEKSEEKDLRIFKRNLVNDFTLKNLKEFLPYFTGAKQEKIKKVLCEKENELTFNQKLEILKIFYKVDGTRITRDNYFDYDIVLELFCAYNVKNDEEMMVLYAVYKEMLIKNWPYDRMMYPFTFFGFEKFRNKLLHPITLRKKYGDLFSKHMEVAAGLINCNIGVGISRMLAIAHNNSEKKEDVDLAFASLRNIKKYAFWRGEWGEHLKELLGKGVTLSYDKNGGDFNRMFEDIKIWYSNLKPGFKSEYFSDVLDDIINIIEEKTLELLKKSGKDSNSALKVIKEFHNHRRETDYYKKYYKSYYDTKKIKEDFEKGYDENLAAAGFMGYFLDKREGKIPSDFKKHLELINLLMPEPSPLRDDILRELLKEPVLAEEEKIKISDLFYDYKEKDKIKEGLYNSYLKTIPDYKSLSYKDKITLMERYFNEPGRRRDEIIRALENKYAESINEARYSSSLKFDKCNEEEIQNSTYFKNNKYLLDPKKRARAISSITSASLIKILLRYCKGPQANEDDKDSLKEERKLFNKIADLHPIDRKNIIKEMLVGLEAFENKYLKDIKVENRTGGFSSKAWKEEFINEIIDSSFKGDKKDKENTNNPGEKEDNFIVWLIKEIFNEANHERSASIISDLIESQTSNLKEEEMMYEFLKASGPIARKLGQILSTNSLVLEKYQKEFAKLKLTDETKIEKEDIIRIIKRELNGKIPEKIQDSLGKETNNGINIDKIEKLLGSASIRTVYKVRVNGKDYALKINDPKSREMAIEDLEILNKLSKKLEESPKLIERFKIQNPRLLLHNLTLSLFQDIDSRIELVNSKKLERVINQEGNHTSKIIYAGPNIVLEEFVDGKGIHKAIKEFNLSPNEVIDKILTSYASQFDKGIFHADPHSENIMITKNGEVYWIDKSMTGDFTKDNLSLKEKGAIFNILFDIGAFGHFNIFHGIIADRIIKHLNDMARVKPSTEIKEKLRENIIQVLQDKGKSAADKFYEINGAAEKNGYIFSENVFMLGKSLITLSGEIKKINPDVNIGDYLKTIILKDTGKRMLSSIKTLIVGEDKEEVKDFLKENSIVNLTDIPWEKLEKENKITKELTKAAQSEFKDVRKEEEAIDALKRIFLKQGNKLSIKDIDFIIEILKTNEVIKELTNFKKEGLWLLKT